MPFRISPKIACAASLARWRGGLMTLLVSAALIATAAAEPLVVEIAAMRASRDQRTGQPIVTITLSEKDRGALARLTTDNIGRVMEIRLDGKVLARPVIREPIMGGVFQISGSEVDKMGAVVDRVANDHPKLELEIVPN